MAKLPFRMMPGSWGLRGKTRAVAEAEYYYEGTELTKKLAEIEAEGDPVQSELIILESKLKAGELSHPEYEKECANAQGEPYVNVLDMGIDTPKPVAYVQNSSFFSFKESYFISEQLDSDYTFRDLSQNIDLENREQILKAFTRLTFNLHEKGIYFLDHSPGNTLVKIAGDSYKFYLVDLNRMEFKTLSFNERIQNFSRLTPDRNVISILSKEYARCIGADPDFIFERMWISTKKFQYNFHKKKRLKKSIRFWKN